MAASGIAMTAISSDCPEHDRTSGKRKSTPTPSATSESRRSWSPWAGGLKRSGSASSEGSRREIAARSSLPWENAFGRGIRMTKQGMPDLAEAGRVAEEAADGTPLWWKIQALANESDQLLLKKLSRNDTSWADDRGKHQ